MDTVEDHVATQEPQKDLMVNGLGIESKTYGRVEPRALTVGSTGEVRHRNMGIYPLVNKDSYGKSPFIDIYSEFSQ